MNTIDNLAKVGDYKVVDITSGRVLYLGTNGKLAKLEARKHSQFSRIYQLNGENLWDILNKQTLQPRKGQ